ncbi:hypothetical protein K469DRAFT_726903 [Zopfia rhizophila CBS 207.26]|uniref:ER-bound oxygenase mpaB/mpaB'/Rubber oxygenase catalytic domain-containing protein n=1 Tax=Zopfia rhizophila CBS 207.26 TaxID=1314779 RepID=A0A6A6E355_9PEZI|nr:hypothetical protein K469DRAFT_726903 [Zopfia rhizophila CBS 207.26]
MGTIYFLPLLLAYLGLVKLLRYARSKSFAQRFGMLDRASYARLSAPEAQIILKDLKELEFPKFMGFSIIFVLFKTYGIPSISSLLVSTGQLSDTKTVSKRTADTALSRMNYLHSKYQKAGKISNDDMLYTLSLFALEPIRWIYLYEWRRLTDLERCACGTFWKTMGNDMHVSFKPFPSYRRRELRLAMGFPPAPRSYHVVIHALLQLRTYAIRYFFFPRPELLRKVYTASEYLSYPRYVRPTFGRRWGPQSWIPRLFGRKLPGHGGNSYQPEGFLFEEIGPEDFLGKGFKEMEWERHRMLEKKRDGCPLHT